MSIVNSTCELMDWLDANVCQRMTLKRRPIDASANDPMLASKPKADAEEYDYELVHPSVLGMYWPTTAQLLPPDVPHTHPGILVQVVGGSESTKDRRRTLQVRLHLCAWDPGRHGRDLWIPRGDGGFVRNETSDYKPDYGGWQDAWSLCDVTLRELRLADALGPTLRIDHSEDVTFGPYAQQDAVVDLYPYWLCWVAFTAYEPAPTPYEGLDDYL